MSHLYSTDFFDYIAPGAESSARQVIALLKEDLSLSSVLDIGCGQGAWLKIWQDAGIAEIFGVDGDYVSTDALMIPPGLFHPADLTASLDLGRRFDLVQCLEVGEHLPASAAKILIESLCRHGDCILFSAAQPGQGGEYHINEQPLDYWRSFFLAQGYDAFDALRPALASDRKVEPWYRYNSVLYLNADGQRRASPQLLETRVPEGSNLPAGGNWSWRLRRGLVRALPQPVATAIAKLKARLSALARRTRR